MLSIKNLLQTLKDLYNCLSLLEKRKNQENVKKNKFHSTSLYFFFCFHYRYIIYISHIHYTLYYHYVKYKTN